MARQSSSTRSGLSPVVSSCLKATEKTLKRIAAGETTRNRTGSEAAVVMEYTFSSAGVGEREVVRAVLSGMIRATCGQEKGVTQLPGIFVSSDAYLSSRSISARGIDTTRYAAIDNPHSNHQRHNSSDTSLCARNKCAGHRVGVEVVVDGSVALPERDFGDVMRVCQIDFDQLPSNNPTIAAVAEAAYLKHLPRTSLAQTYAVTAFPRSLLAVGNSSSDATCSTLENHALHGSRIDVAVGGYVILSLTTDAAGTQRILRIFASTVDVVFRGMCGTDFAAGVLPPSWHRLMSSITHAASTDTSSSTLRDVTLDKVSDVLEDALLAIGEYWDDGDATGLRRTETTHLLRLISDGLRGYVEFALTAAGGPFYADRRVLTLAQTVSQDWLDECDRFARRAWRGGGGGGWVGDAGLTEMVSRLRAVQQMRSVVEEMTELLTDADGTALRWPHVWNAFDEVNLFQLSCTDDNNNNSHAATPDSVNGAPSSPSAAKAPEASLSARTDANRANTIATTNNTANSATVSWETAVTAFERRLQPMEQRCVAVLRGRLSAPDKSHTATAAAPQSALLLFDKFRHLVRRPAIAKELLSERGGLLMRLQGQLQSIRSAVQRHTIYLHSSDASSPEHNLAGERRQKKDGAYTPRGALTPPTTTTTSSASAAAAGCARDALEEYDKESEFRSPYLPERVNRILWLRQLRGRVRAVRAMAESTLSDLSGVSDLRSLAQSVDEEVGEVEHDTYQSWCDEVIGAQEDLRLDESAPLMRITDAGQVEVNYPERLVSLLKEVRIFAVLDYAIPAVIRGLVDKGRLYYHKGVALRQVAHVYNSMSHDILPCTRAILLTPALAFEQIIEAGGRQRLTWRSTEETDRFLAQLRQSATALTEQNRRVRSVHASLRTAVSELFAADVLRTRERWGARMHALCATMNEPHWEHTEAWREYWDAQIYKALECQYQRGLEQLHEAHAAVWGADVVRADVVMDAQTGQAVLRPPLEVIRQQYYERVRDFVTLPRRTTGCSATHATGSRPRATEDDGGDGGSAGAAGRRSPFGLMVSQNDAGIATAMRRAAATFRQVHAALRRWDALLVIGRCDRRGTVATTAATSAHRHASSANPGANMLEEVVGRTLSEVQHWEQAVRLVKQKAKEVNAEELFVPCGRVVLCTASVKAAVEEQLARLSEVLTTTLRRSVGRHVARMEEYLRRVGSCLGRRIGTVAEIGEANMAYAALIQERMSAEVDYHHFTSKNALLQNMTSGGGGQARRMPAHARGRSTDAAGMLGAAAAARMQEVWTEAMQRLDRHESAMEQQLGTLQSSLREHVQLWRAEVARVGNQWSALKPRDVDTRNAQAVREAQTLIAKTSESLSQLRTGGVELRTQLAYFDMEDDMDLDSTGTNPPPPLPNNSGDGGDVPVSLMALETEVQQYLEMWNVVEEFQTAVNALRAQPWIVFRTRLYLLDDFTHQWRDRLAGEGRFPSVPAMVQLRTLVERWGRCAPVLRFLRGDGFTPSHWSELFALLQLTPGGGGQRAPSSGTAVSQDTLTLGQILDKEEVIVQQEGAFKRLQSRAQGEAQIREALEEVRVWASEAKFVLQPHPDRPHVVLIADWKDTLSALSDHYALLMSVKESPYYNLFAADVNRWFERLSRLDGNLRQMNQIQRRWVYLEPIFRRGALPSEAAQFNRVDGQYVRVMRAVAQDSHLLALVSSGEDYGAVLHEVHDALERCQRALNSFLEAKREACPRFYFISDDDLLEILAQSSHPDVIQAHLKKLFMGIHRVQFDTSRQHIVRVYSLEGEVVTLTRAVRVSAEVESWLGVLDVELKATLKANVMQCAQKLDLGAYAAQVLCTAAMINFTRETETMLMQQQQQQQQRSTPPSAQDSNSHGGNNHSAGSLLRQHKSALQAQLREYTAYAGGNSDALMGIKLRALIMDLIHHVEVVDLLLSDGVERVGDWMWRKQLRYYLDSQQDVLLRMTDAQFRYTYEYQGNAPKLVHTPLTDRCYLTLVQGMQLGYGGNPYGPAGTGKTESVKALGNALGRQVLVFNCDEGIDFRSMGRIFTGLIRCGAWGCFDEFNRLRIDQLSAVSQMIQGIQEALKSGESNCTLLGRSIAVNPSAGIFVTLNPAGKGYGGRSKLPDNLKQLFRSIAMSAPDNERIMETILLSEGFESAKALAQKTVEVFRLSAQLLSVQQHYDWGLRAMKAVLRLGGVLVHDFLMDRVAGRVQPSPEEVVRRESEIILESLRVNTLAKLTFDDAVLFRDLLADIFPDVALAEGGGYAELRPALQAAAQSLQLQVVPAQVEKMVQLYEALRQRMGVVLVGPSGSGKSTLIRVLRAALETMSEAQRRTHADSNGGGRHNSDTRTNSGRRSGCVTVYAMNPKAMPRDQLLGRLDPDTREWFDGVLTRAAREVVKEEADDDEDGTRNRGHARRTDPTGGYGAEPHARRTSAANTTRRGHSPPRRHSWILCDGDIDPEWVESLNSVLDDNKLLTMPNGVRIQFGDHVNFIFETHSLEFASPATVSRLGIIYLSDEDVDPRSAVATWLNTTQPPATRAVLARWMDAYFYPALAALRRTAGESGMVVCTTTMGLVRAALSQLHGCGASRAEFAVALLYGLGSYLPEALRGEYATELFHLVGEKLPDPRHPLDFVYDAAHGSGGGGYVRLEYEPGLLDEAEEEGAGEGRVLSRHAMVSTVECQRALAVMRAWVVGAAATTATATATAAARRADGGDAADPASTSREPAATHAGATGTTLYGDRRISCPPGRGDDSRPRGGNRDVSSFCHPFILVGPDGAGKSMLLHNLLVGVAGARVVTMHCSAHTGATQVVEKIKEACAMLHTTAGKSLRPKDAERLVLVLTDLNLPHPDRYGTVQLHALLHQIIVYGGFYDTDLEWVAVERVQIVGSMTPPGSMGRHAVSPRLLAMASVLNISYPTAESLRQVYTELLLATMPAPIAAGRDAPQRHTVLSRLGASAADVARAMTAVYQSVAARYTVDVASHYTFSPRDITRWVRHLCGYPAPRHAAEAAAVMAYEGRRLFVDRLTTAEARAHVTRRIDDEVATLVGRAQTGGAAAVSSAGGGESGPDRVATGPNIGHPIDGHESVFYLAWGTGGGAVRERVLAMSASELRAAAATMLRNYTREYAELDIQLIPEVCASLARIDRVLAPSEAGEDGGGHLLLLARAGVCATAAVRLVAYAQRHTLLTPPLSRHACATADDDDGDDNGAAAAAEACVPRRRDGGDEGRDVYAELRRAMLRAGVEGTAVVLLLEDAHLHHPGVLEAVHSLLGGGEVAGLFTPEELDVALASLRPAAAEVGATVRAYFTQRVMRWLHVVVVMDPTHPHYRRRLRDNPALVTRCAVCWMPAWSEAALRAVVPWLVPTATLLGDVGDAAATPSPGDDERVEQAVSALVAMHMDRVRAGAEEPDDAAAGGVDHGTAVAYSPQHFKALLHNLTHMAGERSARLRETRERLRGGIATLDAAHLRVDHITAEVTEKRGRMRDKQAEADVALADIQAKMDEAGAQKKRIHAIQTELAKEQAEIAARKSRIEAELSRIQPVLDAAMVAVSGIRAEHLAELKSMKTPPAAVQDVMEGVIRLLGATGGDAAMQGGGGGGGWAAMRKVLAAGDIKSQILNLSLDAVSGAARAEAERLIAAKANSFRPEVIGRASRAAAPMASWLQAVVDYSRVLEMVAPMRQELHTYEHNLQRGQDKKRRYETSLQTLESVVQTLRDSFTATTTEAESLKVQLEEAAHTLARAQELLTRLSDEHRRWGQQVAAMTAAARWLPRQCRLAAAFVTYLGNETEAVRHAQMRRWQQRDEPVVGGGHHHRPHMDGGGGGGGGGGTAVEEKEEEEGGGGGVFRLVSFMREEGARLRYVADGLPSDELSAENAVVMEEQRMTPLVEDPAGSVVPWLVTHLRGGGARSTDTAAAVEVCGAGEARLLATLELALRFGKHLLITDVTRVERWWYPILRREWRYEGSRRVVQLGDRRAVEWAESFRLYLITTGLSSAHGDDAVVAPEIAGYLTRVNFALTQDGLEGYFLARAVAHEEPALEQQRVAHVAYEESLRRTLSSLEERLLRDLSAAQGGDLLANDALMTALQEVKQRASEIETALRDGAAVRERLSSAREVYRPLATVARVVVVAVKALPSLSAMYVFSFAFFTALFDRALAQERHCRTDAARKVTVLQRRFIANAVAAVSRALRRDDRVLVGWHLAHALHPEACPEVEWGLLIGRTGIASPTALTHSNNNNNNNDNNCSSSSNRNSSSAARANASASSAHGTSSLVVAAGIRVPGFVLADTAAAYRELATTLPGLVTQMRVHEADVWLRWVRSTTPETQFPSFLDPLTPLQRLLVVKTLRPDRLSAAMRVTACALLGVESLGDEDASAPLATRLTATDELCASGAVPVDATQAAEGEGGCARGTAADRPQSSRRTPTRTDDAAAAGALPPQPTPTAQRGRGGGGGGGDTSTTTAPSSSSSALPVVLLITSAGADASLELQDFAHAAVGKERFVQLAMGGGQTAEAVRLLRRTAAQGEWLFLKNLHLVMDWVRSTLPSELTALTPHPRFRLFLTSEAHDGFPEALLGRCAKMAVEAPPGVRQGMLRTFESWGATMYRSLSAVQRELLFAAAALHAVLQERRSYIPQGWTREYEITPSDIASFTDTVLRYSGGAAGYTAGSAVSRSSGAATGVGGGAGGSGSAAEVDWRAIRGMLRSAIYGGKMETTFDERILSSYIDAYMSARLLSQSNNAHRSSSSSSSKTSPRDGEAASARGGASASSPAGVSDTPVLFPHLRIPAHPNFAAAMRAIAALPESDVPEMFHLPANADRAVQQSRVRVLTASLQRLHEVQRRQHVAAMSHETWVNRLAPVLQSWATCTAPHPHLLTRHRRSSAVVGGTAAGAAGDEGGEGGRGGGASEAEARGSTSAAARTAASSHAHAARHSHPVERYFAAELQTAVWLVGLVDASVTELRRVVEGATLLTEPRRAEAACMMDDDIPPAWLGYFPSTGGFLSWAQALLRRAVAIARWEQMGGGAVSALMSGTAMNLSLLLRARTFLNALRQETAHTTKQPLVALRLIAQSSTPPRGAALPVLLEGLLLQGAILDARDVMQPIETADEPAFFTLPKMYLAWVTQATADEMLSQAAMCVVSVYTNTTKEEHVCDIELPCGSPEAAQRFILAGVSLVLEQ